VHCGHAHLLGSVGTVICCGEAGGGVGRSCLFLSSSSSSLIRRDGPHDAVREVGNGREVNKLGCGPVTRRDSGRPWVSATGSDDWRPRGGREADDADGTPPSLGQSKPVDEFGAGEVVRDGGLLKDRPFSRSQLSPARLWQWPYRLRRPAQPLFGTHPAPVGGLVFLLRRYYSHILL
jgi:hypothetical protein